MQVHMKDLKHLTKISFSGGDEGVIENHVMEEITLTCKDVIDFYHHQAYGPTFITLGYIQTNWSMIQRLNINTECLLVRKFAHYLESFEHLQFIGVTHFRDKLAVRNLLMIFLQKVKYHLLRDSFVKIGDVSIDLTFGGEGDGLVAKDFKDIRRVKYTSGIESYFNEEENISIGLTETLRRVAMFEIGRAHV